MMNTSPATLRHIITSADISAELVQQLNMRAQRIVETGYDAAALNGKIIATLFFEPSTRTRLSFSTAALRSGAQIIGVDQADSSSLVKGETLEDTIKIVSSYADLIVLRHPEAGSAVRAAAVSSVPVINAGDGANAHPTQTLLDLFTIQQALGRLTNFTIGLVGDLKYSRVAHSLAEVLARYDAVQQVWIAPDELTMPGTVHAAIQDKGVAVTETQSLVEVLPELDIVLMTRVQKERFTNNADYERLRDSYILTPTLVATGKPDLKIIAPLPRTNELPTSLDQLPQAYYFTQASFGVPVRAALLEYCLAPTQ